MRNGFLFGLAHLILFVSTGASGATGSTATPHVIDAASAPRAADAPTAVGATCAAFLREGNPEPQIIQRLVDAIDLDIVVVGSAARGERRNPRLNVPIGKRAGEKSDIDYLVPMKAHWIQQQVLISLLYAFEQSHDSPFRRLPDCDHPMLTGRPQEDRHRIWFRPHEVPRELGPGEKNLEIRPWTLRAFPTAQLRFEADRLEEDFVPNLPAATEERQRDVTDTLDWFKAELESRGIAVQNQTPID